MLEFLKQEIFYGKLMAAGRIQMAAGRIQMAAGRIHWHLSKCGFYDRNQRDCIYWRAVLPSAKLSISSNSKSKYPAKLFQHYNILNSQIFFIAPIFYFFKHVRFAPLSQNHKISRKGSNALLRAERRREFDIIG